MIEELLKVNNLSQNITVTLAHFDEHINGFLLAFNKKLTLMQEVNEFHLDGYILFHTEDIQEIRSDEHDQFSERVLFDKGMRAQAVAGLDLDSWGSVFSFFKENNEVIAVETNSDNEEFLLGRVLLCVEQGAELQYIDSMARSDQQPTYILYNSIHVLRFRTEYTEVYGRYAPCE